MSDNDPRCSGCGSEVRFHYGRGEWLHLGMTSRASWCTDPITVIWPAMVGITYSPTVHDPTPYPVSK